MVKLKSEYNKFIINTYLVFGVLIFDVIQKEEHQNYLHSTKAIETMLPALCTDYIKVVLPSPVIPIFTAVNMYVHHIGMI